MEIEEALIVGNENDKAAATVQPQLAPDADMQEAEPACPLVSCIMPTAGRPVYVAQSVQYFLAQDYPNKELVIIYNQDTDLPLGWAACPPSFLPPNIRPIRVNTRIIGGKRNEACRHALGPIIAQWDDDDIYNTHRLTQQVTPILAGEADITGLQSFVFFDAATGYCWMPTPGLFKDIYVGEVHGGSLVFNRQVWEQMAVYPNFTHGEDAWFLRRVLKRGARLLPLPGHESFVYIRHSSNTWQFEANNFNRYPGWLLTTLPAWSLPYEGFYRNMASGNPPVLPASRSQYTQLRSALAVGA